MQSANETQHDFAPAYISVGTRCEAAWHLGEAYSRPEQTPRGENPSKQDSRAAAASLSKPLEHKRRNVASLGF